MVNDMTLKNKKNNSINEWFNKLDNRFFDICSLILLSIWVLYPVVMMVLNVFSSKFFARDIMYYVLYGIGCLGILLGLIYTVKKSYNEKIKIKKYLPIIVLIILLLWCLISCFTTIQLKRSISGTYYRKEGLLTYIFYFGVLLLGIMLKKEKSRKILLNELLIIEVIMAIVSLMNNNITHILTYNQEPYDGIFSQFNHYGYYLLFGILSSIFLFINNNKKIKKLIYLIVYILLLYTLIMNDTFGCFLALLFTLILITIYYRKNLKKIGLILVSFILICIFTYRNGQNVVMKNFNILQSDTKQIEKAMKKKKVEEIDGIGTTRGILWRVGIEYSLKKPITGYGIENLEQIYVEKWIPQDRPHNIFIQFMAFTGIPGMLLYMLFIFVVLKRGFHKIKELDGINLLAFFMVICYLTSSMVGNSMFYTSPYYFIFLGILISNLFYNDKKLLL